MLRKIRIALAVIFWAGITLLFLDFTGLIHNWLGWMAKVQFLPAILALNVGIVVGVLLLTLLLGRVYCSIICPLGVLQDLIGWVGKKIKKNRYNYAPAKPFLRLGVLILFLFVFLLAGSWAALIAPYSLYGRIAQNLFAPIWQWGNNLLATWAAHVESYAFYETEIWLRSLPVFITALLSFIIIFILAWRGGRTYCNTICPVGTVLGYLAKYSLFKPVLAAEKCVNCKLCTRNCKASCIDLAQHRIDYSRCVACMDCIDQCKKGAISYRWAKSTSTSTPTPSTGMSRRRFVSLTALLTTGALVKAQEIIVDGGLAPILDKQIPERKTKIVPPGTGSLRHMESHCTGCQLCVAACPNQVLRPSEDFKSFMQPHSSYERGFCRPECTACSEVCPTGVIRPIEIAEKSSIQIGHAVWIKENCIPLTKGDACGNCARHCPAEAITMIPSKADNPESIRIPFVNPEKCIGCGACEYLCPSRPFSAIYVEGHEQHKII